jgi:hypothetical protein
MKKDVTNYLKYLASAAPRIKDEKLKVLMESYRAFISETIQKRNVLEKRFFLAIPFSPYELGIGKSIKSVGHKSGPLPFSHDYVVKKAETALYPKRDHMYRQAARVGLRLKQLNNGELVALYYGTYQPDVETIRAKEEQLKEVEHLLVKEGEENETKV